jgi:hypothetical protein
MKILSRLFTLCIFALLAFCSTMQPSSIADVPLFQTANAQEGDKLVYADFEAMKNNRPVSSRGGYIQISSNQERPAQPCKIKGLEGANPAAPELVRLSKDDPNKAATFSYELQGPNQWANVVLEIHGQADKDGKPAPDDVTGYKFLTLQVYAKGIPEPTGIQYLSAEFISRGHGIDLQYAYPKAVFKLSSGFNTYRLPLKNLVQDPWAPEKVNSKDVLKKLTAVNINVSCNQCTPINGVIVVDNLIFQN